MRLRTALGTGAVLVAVVAAIVVLRENPAPPGPTPTAADTTTPGPPPTIDARARQLTAAFVHATTVLPKGVRFADDPNNPPGFMFQRYDTNSAPGIRPVKYTAEGSIIRRADDIVLDHVLVIIQADPGTSPTLFGACYSSADYGGASCTEQVFPDGTRARVVRNPAFAQSVATAATAGQPPGLQTELDVEYLDGTRMTVTLFSMNEAGIPLDDAAMLRLATIPGVSAR
jgi:hypothetical protein